MRARVWGTGVEVLPGIHRIESDLGERFMCQYLLVGEDRTLLVDTGLAGTPEEVILPYLQSIGLDAGDIDDVLISHADVDHCGGDAALRRMNGRLRFMCGESDRAWIESPERMLREIYRWSEPHGFGPDEDSLEWMRRELGEACPVDVGLRGGETLRLGPGWRVEVLHLPGHTPGHLGLWDERSGAAIIIDAALETGIYDRAGNRLIPPRYFDAPGYARTLRLLRALQPEHLLTAHYPPMRGGDALGFLDRSLDFTHRVAQVVDDGIREGVTDLWELTRRADGELGPYPELVTELGAGVRAHMATL